MAPKKAVKMDLGSFLQDGLEGDSWADDDIDFSSIEISTKASTSQASAYTGGANPRDPAFGGDLRGGRRQEQDYPIPDAPPYRARVNNLPWDVTENDVTAWIIDFLKDETAISNIVAPKDFEDPSKLKGFAFITLQTQDQLKNALGLSGTQLNGRNVYVSVAAPERERGGFTRRDEPNLDWGAARDAQGSRSQREPRGPREDRPRREEPDLDWGSARDSQTSRPPREPRAPREDRPRREEPDLDWGSARDSQTSRPAREPRAPREDRPKREEPNLDWGAARDSQTSRPAREPRAPREDRPKKQEPEFDWGAARESAAPRPARGPRTDRPKKQEPEFDWGAARGTGVPSRQRHGKSSSAAAPVKEEEKPVAKVVKSSFSVLANEDDDDEEEEVEEKAKETVDESITQLEKATGALSVEENSGDSWVVVGKK